MHHVQRVLAAAHEVLEGVLVGRAEVDRLEALGRRLAVVLEHLVLAGDGEARARVPDAEGAAVSGVAAGVEGVLQDEDASRAAAFMPAWHWPWP